MPFREAEIVATCTDCRELASHACPRCDQPLCERHAVSEATRCIECETDFLRQGDQSSSRSAIGATVLTAGCVATLVIHSASYTAFIPAIGLTALLFAPLLAWTARALTPSRPRKAFLKERDVRRLAGAKEPLLLKARAQDDE